MVALRHIFLRVFLLFASFVILLPIFVQTLPGLHSSYMPQNLAQVEFCASRNSVYVWSNISIYKAEKSWNPNFNTLEPNRWQHDRPAATVIAQQYSSATLASLRVHSRKEKFGEFQFCFTSLKALQVSKCVTWNCVSRGDGTHPHALELCKIAILSMTDLKLLRLISVLDNGLTSFKSQTLSRTFFIFNTVTKTHS
jgi:hypothetical protein